MLVLKTTSILGLAFSALCPLNAMATIDSNLIISRLGVQGNTGYVMFEAGLSESCNWQTVYIDLLTDGGKAMYATAMSAHLSGKSLARIEYSRTSGICNASLIEI